MGRPKRRAGSLACGWKLRFGLDPCLPAGRFWILFCQEISIQAPLAAMSRAGINKCTDSNPWNSYFKGFKDHLIKLSSLLIGWRLSRRPHKLALTAPHNDGYYWRDEDDRHDSETLNYGKAQLALLRSPGNKLPNNPTATQTSGAQGSKSGEIRSSLNERMTVPNTGEPLSVGLTKRRAGVSGLWVEASFWA